MTSETEEQGRRSEQQRREIRSKDRPAKPRDDAKVEWNPRFEAYALEHGLSPQGMLAADEKHYPGGKMVGFMLWIQDQWQQFNRLRVRKVPGYDPDCKGPEDHAAFDAWLGSQTSAKKA